MKLLDWGPFLDSVYADGSISRWMLTERERVEVCLPRTAAHSDSARENTMQLSGWETKNDSRRAIKLFIRQTETGDLRWTQTMDVDILFRKPDDAAVSRIYGTISQHWKANPKRVGIIFHIHSQKVLQQKTHTRPQPLCAAAESNYAFYSLRNFSSYKRDSSCWWDWESYQNISHIRREARQFTVKTGHTLRECDSLIHTH